MRPKLFQRRLVLWPTLLGWSVSLLIIALTAAVWALKGERFLSLTAREPADVLVVEGWIGADAIRDAKAEFYKGNYHYVVATGGLSGKSWEKRRWSYAAEAEEQLLRMGIPRAYVIIAVPRPAESQRTFGSAVAVWHALKDRGVRPKALNVFTIGPHGRRSRLVYAKVFEASTKVGVISWVPPGYESGAWWHSSERANELMKETVGWFFELLLNSGRTSNSPDS